MKSGRALTAEHDVIVKVPWPHMVVYRLPSHKCVDYDTLSVEEFLFAYYEQMFDPEFAHIQSHLHKHLKGLMEDIKDYPDSWEVIRAYHSLVLSRIERGLLKWTDAEKLSNMRYKFVFALAKPRSETLKPCDAYNAGRCNYRKDHDLVQHVCNNCYDVAREHNPRHPRTTCYKLNGYPQRSQSQPPMRDHKK